MGYETHADYILEIRMAKSRKNVLEFLNSLFEKLKPSALKDIEKFLEFKKQDEPNATEIFPWDFRYYNRIRLEKYFFLFFYLFLFLFIFIFYFLFLFLFFFIFYFIFLITFFFFF